MSRPYIPTPHVPAHAVSVFRSEPLPAVRDRDSESERMAAAERMVRFYPAWRESGHEVQRVMSERPRGFRVSV